MLPALNQKLILKLSSLVLLFFSLILVLRAFTQMQEIAFLDFDEANRAEGAKRMVEYQNYLAPLTGGPYYRNERFRVPSKEDSNLFLYPRYDRPPVVYLSMGFLAKNFGDQELFYRLPSFIFGFLTLIGFFLFVYKKEKQLTYPLLFAFFPLIISVDWWRSAQLAHLDTGLAFFLFLSLLSLYLAIERSKSFLFILSGIFWGLAFLSKAQPAVILIFPLLHLFLIRKLKLINLLQILIATAFVCLPWGFLLIRKYNFETLFNSYLYGISSKSLVADNSLNAPIYWYLRWWIDNFRLGLVLFSSLLLFDLWQKKLNWQKISLIVYIFFSFVLYSLAKNKVWWYLLPLIPVVSLYLYYSSKNYLSDNPKNITNILLITILSSLPLFRESTNTISLVTGLVLIIISFLMLVWKNNFLNLAFLTPLIILFSLISFYLYFPKINPPMPEIREVARSYQQLDNPKCLFIYKIPYEAALYYSQSGEINFYSNLNIKNHCQKYLLTTKENQFTKEVIFQQADLKLLRIP